MSIFRVLLLGSFVALASTAHAEKDHGKPPQQAFDACAKAKQGDACSFKGHHDRDVHGTCDLPKDTKVLVCHGEHHAHHDGSASTP